MPTAHEYRHAAAQLRWLGERLASDWTTVRTATDVDRIASGAVSAVLDRSLDTVRTELERTRSELDRLAAICDRRAEICADHNPAWWVST